MEDSALTEIFHALATNQARAKALEIVARSRQPPPVPKGKPAFWWLKKPEPDLRKADIGTLMREAARLDWE